MRKLILYYISHHFFYIQSGSTQNIVDSRSQGLYATREIIRNTGRSNFIYLTVVLSIIVKELIVGNYFRYRKHHRFLFCFITTASNLRAIHKSFNKYFLRFIECFSNSGLYLLTCFDLCYSKTGATQTGLDKTR